MAQSSLPPNVHVSTHPCLQAKISQLRSDRTNGRETKQLVHDISLIIGCEALAASLSTTSSNEQATSHLGYTYSPTHLQPSNISIVPILRSGLSMVDAIQSILPDPVPVFHLGMYRERSTLQPVEYYNNLPYHSPSSTGGDSRIPPPPQPPQQGQSQGPSELAILVDPIIATGETVTAAIDSLRAWGVRRIVVCCVLATVDGLQRAVEAWTAQDGPGEGGSVDDSSNAAKVQFWIGAVDPGLDEKGMIKPGVGDVGDRLFGTVGK